MNKPEEVIQRLQELRDAAESEGDLEAARDYSNAIALVMQAQGAKKLIEVRPLGEPEEIRKQMRQREVMGQIRSSKPRRVGP
jgi:hypothetical protein